MASQDDVEQDTIAPHVYGDRVVAYLDLLGFSNLVGEGRAQDALAALAHVRAIQQRADRLRALNPEWVDFSMFSDSIACSIDLQRGSAEVDRDFRAYMLLNFVRMFCLDLLKQGIATRGAIVRGELHHTDPIVFGPALVAAYQKESKVAVYPRVLVDEEVAVMARRTAETRSARPSDSITKKHRDGGIAIRMFSPWGAPPARSGVAKDVFYPTYAEAVRELRQRNADDRILRKLDWLMADIEEDAAEFGETAIGLWGDVERSAR